jgi:hypothetical protein
VTFKRVVRNVAICLTVGISLLWFTGQRTVESDARPFDVDSADNAERGTAAFMGAGFGGVSMSALSSNAVPWRLTAAALVLEEQRKNPSVPINHVTLDGVLSRFGFLSPIEIVNQPRFGDPKDLTLPLGMTYGTIHPIVGTSIMVGNLGCSSCHAGVTYASTGRPQPDRAMLGMPNSSLDLEAYTQAIFAAMRRFSDAPELLQAADKLFPEMSVSERLSLRWIVLPLAKRRLAELAGVDRPLPFPNGSPGSTNGVAALKFALRSPLADGGKSDAGVVSIPDLGDRVWKTSLLADGAYGVAGKPPRSVMTSEKLDWPHLASLASITTFFTVPSMGVHPDKAHDGLKDAKNMTLFLKDYNSQPFPGVIDTNKAVSGAVLYQLNCASCHGTYGSSAQRPRLVSYPNWIGNVGTDPLRGASFDQALVDAIKGTSYGKIMSVNAGRGYVAPPLSGIWASAPYLHNGSVASLSALLEPSKRHKRFKVGGHELDFDAVGLRLEANGDYRADYQPFSTPAWVDTDQLGRSNLGHTYGNALTQPQKAALIEYLKTL